MQILSPDCPCNGFSRDHVSSLVKQYGEDIRMELWYLGPDLKPDEKSYLAEKSSIAVEQIRTLHPSQLPWLPSTPAALLFNQDGSIAYIGPFSSGIACNSKSSFIDTLLHRINLGQTVPTQLNGFAEGCFCDR